MSNANKELYESFNFPANVKFKYMIVDNMYVDGINRSSVLGFLIGGGKDVNCGGFFNRTHFDDRTCLSDYLKNMFNMTEYIELEVYDIETGETTKHCDTIKLKEYNKMFK